MSIHCHMNVVTRPHSHAYTANYIHVDTCSLCLICFQYDSNLWPVLGKSEGGQGRSVGGGWVVKKCRWLGKKSRWLGKKLMKFKWA
jgi:hypothetical protein